MSQKKPLNLDTGLPLPDAGHASSVFSLTALFGAYFGIFLVLGLPALCGIAFGTVISLLFIRKWIIASNAETFEGFLTAMFRSTEGAVGTFIALIFLVQCAYAASELIILKEAARVLFGMPQGHAALIALSIALVGYFYVLIGGYRAVFVTDILQFVFVALMVTTFAIYVSWVGISDIIGKLSPRPGYWDLPLSIAFDVPIPRYIYQFGIGFVMGFIFLVSAPDTWKRVYIVNKIGKKSLFRFAVFISVGFLPFIMLVPVALSFPPIPDGVLNTSELYKTVPVHQGVFVLTALGLVSCFLSSFDSAMLAGAHVGLIFRRIQKPTHYEKNRYNWLLATVLAIVFCLIQFFSIVGNPYLLGNFLLGPFAIIGGIQAGTSARPTILPHEVLLWIVVVSTVIWLGYVFHSIGFPSVPSTKQINTVPFGVAVAVSLFLICRGYVRWKGSQ